MELLNRTKRMMTALIAGSALLFAFSNTAHATVVLGYSLDAQVIVNSRGNLNPDNDLDLPMGISVPDAEAFALVGAVEYTATALPPMGFDTDRVQDFVLDYKVTGTAGIDGGGSIPFATEGWIPLTPLVGQFALNDVDIVFDAIASLVAPCVGGSSSAIGFCSAAGDIGSGAIAFGLADSLAPEVLTATFAILQSDIINAPDPILIAVSNAVGAGQNFGAVFNIDLQLKAVPEPATFGLLGLGLLGLGALRNKRTA